MSVSKLSEGIVNERVSEREILAGHFQATQERFAAVDGPILAVGG